jgi:hypothetical protein
MSPCPPWTLMDEPAATMRGPVGDGGEPRHQRAPRIAGADHRLLGGRLGDLLQPGVGVLLAGDVHVAVDQAGEHEGVLQVHHRRAGLGDVAVRHPNDPAALHHQRLLRLDAAGGRIGQQAAGVDQGDGLRRLRGRRQRKRGRHQRAGE